MTLIEPIESDADASPATPFSSGRPWPERLAYVLDTMREMSRQTDPQRMVQAYSARMRQIVRSDRALSLSRRGLSAPRFRITRSTTWNDAINPWRSQGRLPLLEGGLLAELIYGDEPVVMDELGVAPDDPAAEYFAGMGSLAAIPLYDQGVSLNMVVLMRTEPAAFRREVLPEHVWMANLFGRATSNLALSDELRRAYETVDRELKAVEDIQRSLLPSEIPNIPTLEFAAHYQTSRRAGGDYYDFFPLPSGQWGILIADVSGHGTPAAVLMAITHSIAHTSTDPKTPPSRLLAFVNDRLAAGYTENGNFITAFYGIYDPPTRRLTFSSAGHPWPRVCRAGSPKVEPLTGEPGLPLGIEPGETYADTAAQLHPGDALVLYTDGITEARSPDHDLFGEHRLDEALLACHAGPQAVLAATLEAVDRFTAGAPPIDDRTLLVGRVS